MTYVVVARHPLDMAVSLYHHLANLDVRRITELAGQPDPGALAPPVPLREWLVSWIGQERRPQEDPDSLPGVIWHARDAWSRRAEPNVVLVHYGDLAADLDGQMRRLAGRLRITVPAAVWPGLVEAAGLASMRARAARLVPGPAGILRDNAAFFRRGRPGAGLTVLTVDELDWYHSRTATMAPADLLAWLHR